MIDDKGAKLTWDAENRLVALSKDGNQATYLYDHRNIRKAKIVTFADGREETTLYIDGMSEVRDGELVKYVSFNNQKLARSTQEGGVFTAEHYYIGEHLQSASLTLDAKGKALEATANYPYGDVRLQTSDNRLLTPYAFTGKEQDAESDFHYFEQRYLSSQRGRFLTPDPVFALEARFVDPMRFSPYLYGRGNPVAYVDPDGRWVNFAVKFVADVALGAALNYAETGNVGLGKAVVEAAESVLDPRKTLKKFDRLKKVASSTKNNGKKHSKCRCFVKGTLVRTVNGLEAIETIEVGDLVATKDDKTGLITWKPVVQLFLNENRPIFYLSLIDEKGLVETTGVTDEHPYWVKGKGWVEALELVQSDQILSYDGDWLLVQSIVASEERQTTYNFEVADYHTYFVGKQQAWVHNSDCVSDAFKKQSAAVDKLVGELNYSKRENVDLKIPGGVIGAIRHTKQTGELVGGSDHKQKGRDILGKLNKVQKRINNSYGMSDTEKSSLLNTVNKHIDDLNDALK